MKNKWMKFSKARRFARSLGLKEFRDWKKYCKSGKKPKNIPAHPDFYKEYINTYDWLGTDVEKRKYKVNDDYFKKWSHDMAYILGFWFADGHIDVKRNIFSICQDTKDRYILEKISRKMKSNHCIYDDINKFGSHYSKITIRSNKIVKDIIRLGGKERKSLDVKFPHIPKKYLPDFIRGLWDGDGTVFYRRQKDKKMHGGASITSGSFDFVKKMRLAIVQNICGIHGNIYKKHVYAGDKIFFEKRYKNSTYYCLYFSVNNARRLRDFIYKNSELKLLRKYRGFNRLGSIPIPIKYLSYKVASQYVKGLHLKNYIEWRNYAKSKKKLINIPLLPNYVYKNKGWKGMNRWIGKEERMLPFNIARKYAIKLKLKTYTQWREFAKSDKRPHNVPSCPDITYKNKGYRGIKHWLNA